MLYIILLILLALIYFFVMPKDIRRSLDIFVIAALTVLIVALAISQAVMNQSLILEIILVLAILGITIKAWTELEKIGPKIRRRNVKRKKNKLSELTAFFRPPQKKIKEKIIMDMEKIEQAFMLINENIEHIEKTLDTDFYDAFVEQNAAFLGSVNLVNTKSPTSAEDLLAALTKNNDRLRALNLNKKEWQKLFQFVLLKGSQVAPMQPNHSFTPDSIATLFQFMIESLHSDHKLRILEMGSGTGNLGEYLLVNLNREIDYVGFEVDDLLLDLSASISEVIGTEATFMQVDAVQSQLMEAVDVVIADLPIGFYPDIQTAQTFQVGLKEGHTFAHHLMIEEAMKYLKESGFAIFLAPSDLLTSSQAPQLKEWLTHHAHLAAVVTLPEGLFKHDSKAIYLIKKTATDNNPTFVYPIDQFTDRERIQDFMNAFQKNVK